MYAYWFIVASLFEAATCSEHLFRPDFGDPKLCFGPVSAGLFALAFRRGLKGCTVFRPNPIRGQILSAGTPEEPRHCCDIEREAD